MRSPSAIRALPLLAAVVLGACSNDSSPQASTPPPTEQTEQTEQPAQQAEQAEQSAPLGAEDGDSVALPERQGDRRQTTGDVPHIQLDAEPVPDVDEELRRRVFLLPGVEDRPSDRSLPGARGLALSGDVEVARPDVIAGSSEFAHIHPDGSLHVWLPVDRAAEVDRTKWGELHPWVGRDGFWGGVAMIYTPETLEELEVTIRLVVDAYNLVTGASLDPTDIA